MWRLPGYPPPLPPSPEAHLGTFLTPFFGKSFMFGGVVRVGTAEWHHLRPKQDTFYGRNTTSEHLPGPILALNIQETDRSRGGGKAVRDQGWEDPNVLDLAVSGGFTLRPEHAGIYRFEHYCRFEQKVQY